MATPVALTCLVPPNVVGNESPVGGRDVGGGEHAAMVLLYGHGPGDTIKKVMVGDEGINFVPPAPAELWAGGTAGQTIAAGATVAIVEDEDVYGHQWILGILRFTQTCEVWFSWSDSEPYNATYKADDDLNTLAANDTFKPDTPRRARYLNVFVHNTSGSSGQLFGHLIAENSGAI